MPEIRRPAIPRKLRARRNVDALIDDFEACLEYFESKEVFGGPSLYFHMKALERRHQFTNAADLLGDALFLDYVYAVLPSWGMHRMGPSGAKVPSFNLFADSLSSCTDAIAGLWNEDITKIEAAGTPTIADEIWAIVSRLRASTSGSRLVSGSKTLHHVLPALVPPIDRQYTFTFFTGQVVNLGEQRAFSNWFPLLCEIGSRRAVEIGAALARPEAAAKMATSTSKVIDNAIVGFIRSGRAGSVSYQ